MNTKKPRVRFAPAPTGMMHVGNIRAALMNYLFARQRSGTFVLRIEDTDPERNFDPNAEHILNDLAWLNLSFDEGPHFQSKRTDIHQKQLDQLIANKQVYRCFCTSEELEKKRERQIALKQPPRYDRTCLKLSEQDINTKLENKTPFIWRMELDQSKSVTVNDLSHGTTTFELKNFSDFPVTRQNGSFTFMFANFVDDLTMNITHVLRGEDHLTNSAGQVALYEAFGKEAPYFLHLPIVCGINGKKLSKRDFGFSLKDLREAGYVPEAICNYLAIIGGSFKEEIMSLDKLAEVFDFEHLHSSGHIKYDVEKLKWINHKWIAQLTPDKLAADCAPFLIAAYPAAKDMVKATLELLIQTIKSDIVVLPDVVAALKFYFEVPQVTKNDVAAHVATDNLPKLTALVQTALANIADHDAFVAQLKSSAKEQGIPLKELFSFMRLALMGATKGPSIHDLLLMLGTDEARTRIKKLLSL